VDRLREAARLPQQAPRQVEALRRFGVARAGHLTYMYNSLRHLSRCTSLMPVPHCPLKFEVIFCVQGVLSPLLANIYLDGLDQELDRRKHSYCRYADDCNIYVGSQAAAERTLASVQGWIEQHLRLKVNAAKSGTGRVWERKFLGFRLDRKKRIGIAPESLKRFKEKVGEMWNGRRSGTSNQLRDEWSRYVRGWWGYYRLAEARTSIRELESWTRRHIRKCFWLRWHGRVGRERNLRRLGLTGRALGVATSSRGAWRVAAQPELHQVLSNSVLRRYGFVLPSDLAAT
jgi:RNA-directed DNA polymerase